MAERLLTTEQMAEALAPRFLGAVENRPIRARAWINERKRELSFILEAQAKLTAEIVRAEERKALGVWLENTLEDSFVMAYVGEDEPYESTIDPITIREIIQALKEGKGVE